jgi:hypothetical protein
MTRMQNIIHKKILEALNNVNIILWKHFSSWVYIFVVWLKITSSWICNFVDFEFVPKIKFMVYIFTTLGSKSLRKLQYIRQMSSCFPSFIAHWILNFVDQPSH